MRTPSFGRFVKTQLCIALAKKRTRHSCNQLMKGLIPIRFSFSPWSCSAPFDKPVLSEVEGLRANGTGVASAYENRSC
jgi:hypothetical protein